MQCPTGGCETASSQIENQTGRREREEGGRPPGERGGEGVGRHWSGAQSSKRKVAVRVDFRCFLCNNKDEMAIMCGGGCLYGK